MSINDQICPNSRLKIVGHAETVLEPKAPEIVSGAPYSEPMIIDCDSCSMRDVACKDCVVTFLIDTPFKEREGASLDAEEARVIDLLASRGLVPPLRYAENHDSQISEAASG